MNTSEKWTFGRSRIFGAALGAAFLLTMGCGTEEPRVSPADQSEMVRQVTVDEDLGFTYQDHVYWLHQELFVLGLELHPDSIRVPEALREGLSHFQPGDVLITDFGPGYWRKVTAVRLEDDGLIIATRDAKIEEVIRDGDIVMASAEGDERPPSHFRYRRERYGDDDLGERQQAQLYREERFERLNSGGGGGGGVVVRPGDGDGSGGGTTRPTPDPVETVHQIADSLDLSVNLTANRHFDTNRNRTVVQVSDGAIQYRPAYQFQIRIRDGVVVNEEMRLSGNAWLDAIWDVEAKGQDAFQQAFSVPNLGAQQFSISEKSRIIGNTGLSPRDIAEAIDAEPGFTAQVVNRGTSTVEMTFGGRTRTYDGIRESGSDRIPLAGFTAWVNNEFGDLGIVAEYSHPMSSRLGRMEITVAANNAINFQIAGRNFEATPDLRVRYQYTGSGHGVLRTGLVGDGMVEAGYRCTTNGCQALSAQSTQLPFGAFSIHNVRSGEPTVDFRAHLEAGVVFKEGVSEYARISPLKVTNLSNSTIDTPSCPLGHSASLRSDTEIIGGSSYRTTDRVLFDESGIASNVPGCSQGDPDDINRCATDMDCAEGEICGFPGNACIPDGDLKVYLSWERSETNLDLYVETPDGVVTPINRQVGGGEIVLTSAGGTECDNCAGSCIGSWTASCESLSPTNNECPYGCALEAGQPEVSGGLCEGTYVSQCSAIGSFSSRQNLCPSGCTRICGGSPGITPGLPRLPDFRDFFAFDRDRRIDDGSGGGVVSTCGCIGTYYTSCSELDAQSCGSTAGCNWTDLTQIGEDTCGGGVRTCDDLDRNDCQSNAGCEWMDSALELPPYAEIFVFDEIEVEDGFRIWVVNTTEGVMENINYGLFFDVRDREDFVMNGLIEAPQMSRSVFYDYVVPPKDGRPDGECYPEPDSAICGREGKECGIHQGTFVDNCGETRTQITCGDCPVIQCSDYDPVGTTCPGDCVYHDDTPGGRCGGGLVPLPCSDGQCVCGGESDAELCSLHGKNCGTLWLTDSCGSERQVDCGGCPSGVDCSDNNTCCQPETDAELCGPPEYDAQGRQVRPSFYQYEFVIDPVTEETIPDASNTSCSSDADCGSGYGCDMQRGGVCVQTRIANFACGVFNTIDSCGNNRRVNCGMNSCASLNQTDVRVAGPFDSCVDSNVVVWAEQLGDITHSCGEVVGSSVCVEDSECAQGEVCACPPGQASCSAGAKRCVRFPDTGLCEAEESDLALNELPAPRGTCSNSSQECLYDSDCGSGYCVGNANPPPRTSTEKRRYCSDLNFVDPWECRDGQNCGPNSTCICEPGTRIGQGTEPDEEVDNCAWSNECVNTGAMERDEYVYSCASDSDADPELNVGACGHQIVVGRRTCTRDTDGRELSETQACYDGDYCTREDVDVAEACQEAGVQCGTITTEDNCGVEVEVTCECSGGDQCLNSQCVECLNNSHCSGSEVCDQNECVECTGNGDCADTCGAWSACDDDGQKMCNGERSRTCYTGTCSAGSCQEGNSFVETESCDVSDTSVTCNCPLGGTGHSVGTCGANGICDCNECDGDSDCNTGVCCFTGDISRPNICAPSSGSCPAIR